MSMSGILFAMLPKQGEVIVTWSPTTDSRGVDTRVVTITDRASGETLFVANINMQVPRG